MRAARTMLAIICAAGAVTAMATPAGSALAASHPDRAAAKTKSWLPPTPGYWPQVVGEQSTGPQTVTGGAGGGEAGQGAGPEGRDWATLFGHTHYAYTDGAAEVIETDSANGGLLASDRYQVPVREQYAWLVAQLNASTSKDIVLLTSRPAYDPHPAGRGQFSDRYEARMYEQLAADYQRSHPWQHVILLSGQARGLAEQVLDPDGTQDPGGLPNFTVADAGVRADAAASQGGFYNYALFHVLPDGTIQFAFQPVLDGITVTAPRPGLAPGARERLTATGTTPAGDDLAPLRVPVADPASHRWSSSDPAVAAVDPSTGNVLARSPGTATISVLSGGVTGSVTVTVSRRRA